MWKLLKALPSAFVVALVVAAIASAAPSPRTSGEDPVPNESPAAEIPPETEPVETEPESAVEDEAKDAAEGEGRAPDFTECAGLTGLDNAICRHERLLVVHPEHHGLSNSLGGLSNSLGHLNENKAKHEEGTESDGSAVEDEETEAASGHGNGNGHGNG